MSPTLTLVPDHRRRRPDPSRRTLTTTEARAILRPRIAVQMVLFEEPAVQRPAPDAGGER